MKQKIIHIVPTFSAGGAERLVLEYAQHLDRATYEVTVASCVEDGELRSLIEATGVDVYTSSRKTQRGRIGAFIALWKFVNTKKPAIIHSHLISSDVFAFVYTRFHKATRWVTTLHNVEHNRPWWYHLVWRMILLHADQVIAVSSAVATYAKETFRLPADHIHLVLNGIDLKRWMHTAKAPLFTQTPLQLATIGRFETQKGHTFLFDALAQIRDIDWQYHTFGDGSLRDALVQQAEDLGIADRIVWHGIVSDLPDALRHIDVVVQPSLWEGLSLTVMEAMAAGRVLLTTTPAAAELATHGETAYVVPEAHADALADALRHIHDDNRAAARIAAAGKKYAWDHFSFDVHLAALTSVYTSLQL